MYFLSRLGITTTFCILFLNVVASEQDAKQAAQLRDAIQKQDVEAVSNALQSGAPAYFCVGHWLFGKQTCTNALNFAFTVYQRTGDSQLLNDVFKHMPTQEALDLLNKKDSQDNRTPRQLFDQSQLAQGQKAEEFFGQYIRRIMSK